MIKFVNHKSIKNAYIITIGFITIYYYTYITILLYSNIVIVI